jgi:hypothetical protein
VVAAHRRGPAQDPHLDAAPAESGQKPHAPPPEAYRGSNGERPRRHHR